jgi:hypothetical protein
MAGAVAACVMLALGGAYYVTYEPAPRIAVRWPEGIDPARREALERQFLLVRPTLDRDRVEYDLLDTSRGNLEALVRERDVADTDRVSRERFTIPLDVPYGTSWMWVAHRTPVLRVRWVIPAVLSVCALLLVTAVALELRWRFRRRV